MTPHGRVRVTDHETARLLQDDGFGGAWALLPDFGVRGLATDSPGRFRDTPSSNLSGETTVIPAKAIKDFAASLRGRLVTMSYADYDHARRLWNKMFDEHPALIAQCSGAADVAKSIRFARERDLLVAVRGGGHSYQGYSTCNGGLVIDLSSMRNVRVDPIAKKERAQMPALGLAMLTGRRSITDSPLRWGQPLTPVLQVLR
jgi:hypothetical protein